MVRPRDVTGCCAVRQRGAVRILAATTAALVLLHVPRLASVHRQGVSQLRQQAASGPAVGVSIRGRYDRGHRNWSKHMRELLNHSAAWDYDTAWAPALRMHKASTAALLGRIVPPELALDKLRAHSPTAPALRIAYIVFAHNLETLHGAERLVQWLYHPAHTFVFHLDYAAPVYLRCYLQGKYGTVRNVHFSNQERSAYGSFGIVRAELAALRAAVAADTSWEIAVPIAGGALPVKPPATIECFLRERRHEMLVSAQAAGAASSLDPRAVSIIPTQEAPALHPSNPTLSSNAVRTTTRCADGACGRLLGTPGGAHWWKGSQWHMLGRLFVEYVLTDAQAKPWLDFFDSPAFLFAADESWANTIAHHSPFHATTTYDRQLGSTMALWLGSACRSHRNPRKRSSPCYLGLNDWDTIINSTHLFARKFLFNDPVVPRVREELVWGGRSGAVC
eukprot:jgi/Tetstr1/449271/TSEL_036474.t1